MQPDASQARLGLCLGSLAPPLLALQGEEGLSESFRFHLDILAAADLDPGLLIDTPAAFHLTDADGHRRQIAGIVRCKDE